MSASIACRRLTCALVVTTLAAAVGAHADEPKSANRPKEKVPRIGSDDAARHVDKQRCVTMTVRSSRYLDHVGLLLLNSRRNYRDEKNFTAVIIDDVLGAYPKTTQEAGPGRKTSQQGGILRSAQSTARGGKMERSEAFFRDKTIRVTGWIILYQKRPQIVVDSAEQIEIVDCDREKEKAAGANRPPADDRDGGGDANDGAGAK